MTVQSPGTPDASSIRSADVQKSRRYWLRVLWLFAVAVILALFFAPIWVGRHWEKQGLSLRGESGEAFLIRADKISLGWLSPIRLTNVSIRDGDGQTLLRAETVASTRPLARLVVDRSRFGRVVIHQPQLDVRVNEDGSNLEDLIDLLRSRKRSRAKSSEATIQIHDGRIELHDSQGELTASLEEVEFSGNHRRGDDREIDFELTAIVVQEDQRRTVQAAADWRGPRSGLPLMSGIGTAALKLDPLSLKPFEPYLTRLIPDVGIHSGSLAGQVLVECDLTDAQTVAATGQLVIQDLHATTGDDSGGSRDYQWDEETLAFQLDGTYEPQGDVVTLSDVTLQTSPLSISATGTISDVHGTALVDVGGKLQYDVAPLLHAIEAEHGEHIQVEGLVTRSISLRGPLARLTEGRPRWDVSGLNIAADLGWDAAEVFGVRSEQALVAVQLQNETLSVEPRHVPVSGGRFVARPQFELLDGQPTVHIEAGPALEDVELSPEMCRLWLKYLSPPLADTTQINGRFSLSFQEGHIPLNRLESGRLQGLFHVHSAEIRPGPFAMRVIGIVRTIRELTAGKGGRSLSANNRLISMDDQRISFAMDQGRVHHERLEFTVAGAAVQTSGSIGFDDTLDLLIEFPLPESWLGKNDLRNVLGGEVLRIPVRGTLDQPQFDLLAVRELTRRMAVKATGSLLRKLLD